MPARLFGRYEIRQEIGRGGMAHVYLAHDPTFRRQVAIKVLPPHFLDNPVLRARFEREARLIATIEHPAIVPVYDFGEQEGQLYLVMRYMPGGSLQERIRRAPLSLARASEILTLLAPALDAVHAQEIVHRDLKPANILLDAFDNPALSDFGIAHFSEATVDLTGEAIIGTPAYMSPEQVRADVALDGRSDIYSLGVILFEMLVGRQPYQAATPMSIAMRHLMEPVPDIHSLRPELPVSFQTVLDRALAKDRDRRYKHATDMAADLRVLLDAHPSLDISQPSQTQTAETQLFSQISDAPAIPAGTAPSGQSQEAQAPIDTAGAPRRTGSLTSRVRPGLLVGIFLLATLAILGLRFLLPSITAPSQPVASQPGPAPGLPDATLPLQAETRTSTLLARLVLLDDFSSPANGWPQGSQDRSGPGYQNGSYVISVQENGSLYWAAPQISLTDMRLSVEVRRASGDQGYYGLLCRIQDAGNFYYFIVRPDGYFTIGKYQAASFSSLTPGGWTFHQAIQTGDATNRLEAVCSADRLTFSVNDVLLGEATDSTFSSGKPGLVAAALDELGFQAGFNLFAVYDPHP